MAVVRPPLDRIAVFLLIILRLPALSLSDPDADALLKLKASFVDNEGLASWVATSRPCTGWAGVVCFNNIITGLHLSDLGLSGKIDMDALLAIRSLRTLSFSNNDFSGPIPDFNRLGALKALLLSKNHFSGDIPSDYFSKMSSLKKVWLSENNFTGPIPTSLSQIQNLLELHLEQNQFSGNIPSMEKEKLVQLNLSNNKLEGKIPESIVKFGADAFKGNVGLCGKPLATVCPEPVQNATSLSSSLPDMPTGNSDEGSQIIWTVLGILAVGVVFSAIYNSRKKKAQFSVLGREVVHEAVDVRISSRAASSRKSSSMSMSMKKGSSRSLKPDVGDMIMLNNAKGTFGMHDLMKAAAEVLGNGGLGSAYKAIMNSGLAVVVKRLREMNKLGSDGFDAEMRRFGNLRHPNILTPLAYHYRREEKLLVSEYIPKGSLLYVLHGDRGDNHAELTWPIRLKIVRGIASGLAFLHKEYASYDLPHGNLKSSNVLLGDNYEPLLNDYAFQPFLSGPQASLALFAYKAPESIQNQKVSPKCDVYCLGVIILEIMTGKFPTQYLSHGKGGTDVVQWVHSAISENRAEEVLNPELMTSLMEPPSEMVKLLHIGASCTESNPEHRPDLGEAIRRIEEVKA